MYTRFKGFLFARTWVVLRKKNDREEQLFPCPFIGKKELTKYVYFYVIAQKITNIRTNRFRTN